jgi:hypothetical protein
LVFVLFRGDAGDGADFEVAELAGGEGGVDEREVGEGVGDADVLAGGDGAEADAPGQTL